MNRRTWIKAATFAPVLWGQDLYPLPKTKSTPEAGGVTPITKNHLYGNAFDLLPTGATDTVETIAQVIDRKDIYMLIKNNGNESVILGNATGLIRDSDGTPLSVPLGVLTSSEILEPGAHALVEIVLGDAIDSPEDVVSEISLEWEPYTEESFVFTENLTVIEAVKTDTRVIGTIMNETEESVSGWLVMAFCFDEKGELVGAGWDADLFFGSDGFSEGDTEAFGATFYFGKPTDRFIVGARTQ